MDGLTLTILVILSFLLVWLGIMIFTTKPEEEEEEQTQNSPQAQPQPQLQMQSQTQPEQQENTLIEQYERRIAELNEKIRNLEMKPTNDTLLDWLADLRRENEFLKLKLAQMNGSLQPFPKEDENLRKELEEYKERVKKLEMELEEMKSNLDYYRLMLNRLQGRYTVINKYNYRMCIRDPQTGEYHYELVKLPPDFDPFNPNYITRDGIEVYEEYGIRIPTKLGDIIRQEFKKDMYAEIGLHR
ncbi:MAG: hypothetical protein FE044_03370 [Thermoplasmata archaeon]|nr:MAG: hypothetical protein FE044_03370 [Thermoplasmata archaeon]